MRSSRQTAESRAFNRSFRSSCHSRHSDRRDDADAQAPVRFGCELLQGIEQHAQAARPATRKKAGADPGHDSISRIMELAPAAQATEPAGDPGHNSISRIMDPAPAAQVTEPAGDPGHDSISRIMEPAATAQASEPAGGPIHDSGSDIMEPAAAAQAMEPAGAAEPVPPRILTAGEVLTSDPCSGAAVRKDARGTMIPGHLLEAFADPWHFGSPALLDKMISAFEAASAWSRFLQLKALLRNLASARQLILDAQPAMVHRECNGRGCQRCEGAGYLPRWRSEPLAGDGGA
jgi:hypothetical protein